MTVDDLVKIKGVGIDKAVTICAAVELGRRLGELKSPLHTKIFSAFMLSLNM